MSAFCDLWFGTQLAKKPAALRKEHKQWMRKSIPFFSAWQSLPDKTFEYLQELATDEHHLIVLGQFYEPVELSVLLNRCRQYVTGETGSFNDPAGHYIIFLVATAQKALYIFTNRLGTYHAYHSSDGKNTAIGTYFLGLAQQTSNKRLDWAGVSGFMGMGFFPNDTTYLQNIKILNPASCYHFGEDLELISATRYWHWDYNPQHRTRKDYIEELNEVLTSSMNFATIGKRVAMPISGGLDSRQLAGVLTSKEANAGQHIWGYSYGYSADSVEIQIAEAIAKARNLPFNGYKMANYLFDLMDLIVDSVDLFQYVDGTRQACMKDLLEDRSDLVIGGHWGDVWMDDMGLRSGKFTGSRSEMLAAAFNTKIVKKGSDWLLSEICNEYHPDSKQYLQEYFSVFTERYSHIDDPDFVMKIFKTDQWSFRWTLASIRMYQAAVFPVLPFYDRRIVDFFQKVPTSTVAGRELQIAYLKRYHPDLAAITWQEYGNNLYQYKYFNNRSLAYRAVKKILRTIKGKSPVMRNWEVFYLNEQGRKQLERILTGQAAFRDVVPENKCKKLLDEFYRNPSAENGYAVSMLHTLAQFIKKIS